MGKQQATQQPSTPQRTVLTLSPTGGTTDYSRLLPSPSKTTGIMLLSKSKTNEVALPTLTPERAHQKLQSPRRTSQTAAAATTRTTTTTQTHMSAFTSPQQQQQRRLPTETALAEGELSFFAQRSCQNADGAYILPQQIRPVNQSYIINSPQRTTNCLEYISPATTPAKSDNDDTSPLGDFGCDAYSNINSERNVNIISDGDVAGMVIPVKAAAMFSQFPAVVTTKVPQPHLLGVVQPPNNPQHHLLGAAQPVHLLEQQHEQLLLQQEQELLQRQLQKEFHEEQRQTEEELALQEFQNGEPDLTRIDNNDLTQVGCLESNEHSRNAQRQVVERMMGIPQTQANHILAQTLTTHMGSKSSNDPVPEAVNTSTESTSSSTDPDTSSGFDLNDLAGELRNHKVESDSQHSSENAESHTLSQHHRRNSATSFDTLGAPKPASLAQSSMPPSNLQKPVPLNPAKGSPKLPLPSKKRADLLKMKTSPYVVPADDRTRAVTPIVRMRNRGSEQMDATADENKPSLNEDDIKAIKQRNWKEKMKLVKKTREKEKEKLEHDESQSNNIARKEKSQQQAKKSKPKVRKITSRKEPSFFVVAGQKYQIPTGIPTCKGDVIELLERFMTTRCGNVDDTYDGDEEADDESVDSNELSFYSEDERSVSESEPSIVVKQEKAISKFNSRSREVNHFSESSPKHSITVDINDKQFIRQFIATATTEGIFLLSHKKNRSKALRRPTKNTAFLRRGVPTRSGNFIGPNLVWKEIKGDEEGEIDLFAIRSLEKATALELENYPYAMPGRSLFLRLNKGVDYVFEARDETEALRFVHGMRWLIARLAFNLIIGNVSVSCELLDVGGASNIDDRYGMFPNSVKEETRWTTAMNEVTTHLVQEVSKSIQ